MTAQHRPDIDGLRAIAVLSVVAYHAFPAISPGGFIGVDIFFVISGYLITGIIYRGINDGTFSILDFYARRARRIFPALAVVLISLAAAGWFLLRADEYSLLGKHILAGAGFFANILLNFEAGYFDVSSIYKPLLHLWSLGVEEQFYFFWPTALLLAPYFRIRMSTAVLLWATLSFSYCVYLTPLKPSQAFYLPMTRIWELAAGGGLAMLGQVAISRKLKETMAAIGLMVTFASLCFVREGWYFPTTAIFPVMGAVALLAFAPGTMVGTYVLGNPVARWVGLISYPLYLWHWPLLSFPAVILGEALGASMAVLAIVAAFVLAALTYYLVEQPIRRPGHLYGKAVGASGGLAIAALVGSVIFLGNAERSKNASDFAEAQAQLEGAVWPYMKSKECENRFPVPGTDKYRYWFCVVSGPNEPDVLLLGSSHANSYYPTLIADKKLANRTVLSIGACEPSWVDRKKVAPPSNNEPCLPSHRADQQDAIDAIISKGAIKLVIMDGLLSLPTPDYIVNLKKRIDFIEANGARVLILIPHVKSDYYISACFSKLEKISPARTCHEPQSLADKARSDFAPLVQSITASNPNVRFFDPNTQFCDGAGCSFVQDGLPIFRDEYSHLSRHGSKLIADAMLDDNTMKWAFSRD